MSPELKVELKALRYYSVSQSAYGVKAKIGFRYDGNCGKTEDLMTHQKKVAEAVYLRLWAQGGSII